MALRLGQRPGRLDLVRAADTQLVVQPRPDMGLRSVVVPRQLATQVDVPLQRAGQRRERDLRWQEAALRAQPVLVRLPHDLCEPQGVRSAGPDVGRHGSQASFRTRSSLPEIVALNHGHGFRLVHR